MSERLQTPASETLPGPTGPEISSGLQQTYRETVLRDLLGVDYDFAKEGGLIDAFYVDPETGEDGLLHILGGDVAIGPDGANIPQGFHHEPSARDNRTFVDRTHLVGANKEHRKLYREFPYEPYAAHVVIDGLAKQSIRRRADGAPELVSTHSNMFPKEYDALAVMRAILQARDKRDINQDTISSDGRVVVNEGEAVLLDGTTSMNLRLVLDTSSGKIISAYPLERKKSGYMSLSKQEVQHHLGL